MSLRGMMGQPTVVWPWGDIKANTASVASAVLHLRGVFKGTPAFAEFQANVPVCVSVAVLLT